MHFDIQYSRPSLRYSSCVCAMKDKKKCSRCYFGYLSMPLTNNFYNAALYVLPEAPRVDSLLLKTDLESSHHVWKKCIQRCYSIFCLESKKRLISIVIWQTVPWPGQILLLQVFLSPMNKNQIKLYFCSCVFFAFTMTVQATVAAINGSIKPVLLSCLISSYFFKCSLTYMQFFSMFTFTHSSDPLLVLEVAVLQRGHMVAVCPHSAVRATWKQFEGRSVYSHD